MDKEQQEGIGIRWCGGHRTRWRMHFRRRGFLPLLSSPNRAPKRHVLRVLRLSLHPQLRWFCAARPFSWALLVPGGDWPV